MFRTCKVKLLFLNFFRMRVAFGKYKGQTYADVCNSDSAYIRWVASKPHRGDGAFDAFRQYCRAVLERSFVYVLPLTRSKYYVGTTSFPVLRLRQHCSCKGSMWTRAHPPISGYSKLQIVPNDVSPGIIEDMWVKQLMLQHGMDVVRGGSYTQVQLDEAQKGALRAEMEHARWQRKRSRADVSVDCPTLPATRTRPTMQPLSPRILSFA